MLVDIDPYSDEEKMAPMRRKGLKIKISNAQHLREGRIIEMTPEGAVIWEQQLQHFCSIKGSLKKDLKQKKQRLCCGDLVLFDPQKKVIEKLQDRQTVLHRQNPSHKNSLQILAANIDLLIITTSIKQPALNPYLIDLYIATARKANVQPIIVFNKVDLLPAGSEEEQFIQQLIEQYTAIDIPCVKASAQSREGLKTLQNLMKQRASAFSGQSGVGKSSLINALEKKNLKVSSVSEKTHQGTHTTTSSKLLELSLGGWCVDTPGVQSLGFKKLTQAEVRDLFTEMRHIHCKFQDCQHLGEKGCVIEKAVEEKHITELRLESYYRLLKEVT